MSAKSRVPRFLIHDNGSFVAFAQAIADSGGDVLYHSTYREMAPYSRNALIGRDVPGVQRVDSIWEFVDDVDVICFPDVGDGDVQTYLRKAGYPVWGCGMSEQLELDRWAFKQLLTKLDLPVIPTRLVVGLDALHELLEEEDDLYLKFSFFRGDAETFHHINWPLTIPWFRDLQSRMGPHGAELEIVVETSVKAIEVGYDGWCVNGHFPKSAMWGIEAKDRGYIGRACPAIEMPKYLQTTNEAIAEALGLLGMCGNFSSEVRVAEDGTAYLNDPTTRCYSDDTEILTERGWLRFSELNDEDCVATLNPDTRSIEYQRPTARISYRVDGKLLEFSNAARTVELLVTPNHMVWASSVHAPDGPLIAAEARHCRGKRFMPRTGKWTGLTLREFSLPAYRNKWRSGRAHATIRVKQEPARTFPIHPWLRLLAWYLSDGSCSRWAVHITQTDKVSRIQAVLDELGISWAYSGRGFEIANVQLRDYFARFGVSHEKRVPAFIKTLSPELINVFLDEYTLGDGTRKCGSRVLSTTSPKLADELQELFMKAGSVARVTRRVQAGTAMKGLKKSYARKHDLWIIAESASQQRFYFEASGARRHRYIKNRDYCGMVHDVTVPNGIVYVRRNGAPVFSGNCPAPPIACMSVNITNWAEIVLGGAHGEIIEPEISAEWAAEVELVSSFVTKEWLGIEMPPEVERFVRFRRPCVFEGRYWCVPSEYLDIVGSAVGLGTTPEAAIDAAIEVAEQVQALELHWDRNLKQELLESLKEAEAADRPKEKANAA